MLFDQYGCFFGFGGGQAAFEKVVNRPETKNPAGLSGEQGSRNFDDLCEILNYLLASLVRSSFAQLGCPKPMPVTDHSIPIRRNLVVAGECFDMVRYALIGDEGIAL